MEDTRALGIKISELLANGAGLDIFNRFVSGRVQENELDLLLVDEAHRVEKTSNHQYTRLQDRYNSNGAACKGCENIGIFY